MLRNRHGEMNWKPKCHGKFVYRCEWFSCCRWNVDCGTFLLIICFWMMLNMIWRIMQLKEAKTCIILLPAWIFWGLGGWFLVQGFWWVFVGSCGDYVWFALSCFWPFFKRNFSSLRRLKTWSQTSMQGCHQEPAAGDFTRLLREWPRATFIGKQKKNRTKRNP